MESIEPPTWSIIVNDSFGKASSGAGVFLVSTVGYKLNCALRFRFKVPNNISGYMAL